MARMIEFREVGGRGADNHPLGAALLGATYVDEFQTVGLAEFLARLGLGVGREVVVIADGEMVTRRSEFGGAGRDESDERWRLRGPGRRSG